MIDSKFIIRYTNGLYVTDKNDAPRYDEFRDMFSSGQIRSKEWAITELKNTGLITNQHMLIVGAWYGTLGLLANIYFPDTTITLLDFDPRCEKFIRNITYDTLNIKPITADMYEHEYQEDIVINTSCEHISDIVLWINQLLPGTIVLLQSNNYLDADGHINCVNSIDEFKKQTNLSHVLYSGELEMSMYTRYMIIGIV
jgi:16S rRNA G527 N7-methylase RsmG